MIYINRAGLSWVQWIAFGISHFATQTHAKVQTCTHTHSPPKQFDKVVLSEKKGQGGTGGGLLCDNGFHQIPLSQIKMPAWRALVIFLFICLLFFSSDGECHRISGPIYCHRPATHTRRSQPQSDRPLSYSPHRWFLLIVLIAKLSPLTSHHIAPCGAVCAFVPVSVSLMEDVVSVPLEESTHWEKMPKLELFSVIT